MICAVTARMLTDRKSIQDCSSECRFRAASLWRSVVECGLCRLASHYWKTKEACQRWLKQQTMLVNENRLNFADPRARKYLIEQTERHFFGEGVDMASGYASPKQ